MSDSNRSSMSTTSVRRRFLDRSDKWTVKHLMKAITWWKHSLTNTVILIWPVIVYYAQPFGVCTYRALNFHFRQWHHGLFITISTVRGFFKSQSQSQSQRSNLTCSKVGTWPDSTEERKQEWNKAGQENENKTDVVTSLYCRKVVFWWVFYWHTGSSSFSSTKRNFAILKWPCASLTESCESELNFGILQLPCAGLTNGIF